MRRPLTALAACGALLSACNRGPTKSPPTVVAASEPGPSKAAAGAESAAVTARRLALQPPHASASVDVLIVNLQRAAERNPGKGERWVGLGRAWVRKARETADPGFFINAKAAADVALDVDSGDATALDLEGLVLLNDHEFEGARALAERVVDGHPHDPSAFGTLSDAMLELGRFDDASRTAQEMMDLKPNLPSYSRASYLRWLAGDVDGAKRAARFAIDCGGDHRDPEPRAWALTQAAMIFVHEGDYDGGDAGFDRALDQLPTYSPALVGKARVAMARGDARRAEALLQRAYYGSPLVETAWLLGDARSMAGDEAGSRDAYTRVERTGRRTDRRTLALFWATRNEHPAEALALAEGERATRADVYTEDAYAWALYRNGRIAEARSAIGRARAHGTRDARLLYHAGAIGMAAGDMSAGLHLVRQALQLEPWFDMTAATEARRLLEDQDH